MKGIEYFLNSRFHLNCCRLYCWRRRLGKQLNGKLVEFSQYVSYFELDPNEAPAIALHSNTFVVRYVKI